MTFNQKAGFLHITSINRQNIGALGLNPVWNVNTVKCFSLLSVVRMDHIKGVLQNRITLMDCNLTDGSKMRDMYSGQKRPSGESHPGSGRKKICIAQSYKLLFTN